MRGSDGEQSRIRTLGFQPWAEAHGYDRVAAMRQAVGLRQEEGLKAALYCDSEFRPMAGQRCPFSVHYIQHSQI